MPPKASRISITHMEKRLAREVNLKMNASSALPYSVELEDEDSCFDDTESTTSLGRCNKMALTFLDEEAYEGIKRQVEYYFSDHNLSRVTPLLERICESEDGMVPLSWICSFPTMRSYLGLPYLVVDEVSEDVVKAVAEMFRTSEFLKVSEDGKKVGKRTEVAKPEEGAQQLNNIMPLVHHCHTVWSMKMRTLVLLMQRALHSNKIAATLLKHPKKLKARLSNISVTIISHGTPPCWRRSVRVKMEWCVCRGFVHSQR